MRASCVRTQKEEERRKRERRKRDEVEKEGEAWNSWQERGRGSLSLHVKSLLTFVASLLLDPNQGQYHGAGRHMSSARIRLLSQLKVFLSGTPSILLTVRAQ